MACLSLSSSARAPALTLVAFALLVGGCTSDRGRFPSLAKRPAERAFGTAQPVNVPVVPDATAPLPPSADVAARITALREQARSAHRTFESRQPIAARAAGAARGAAVGGEAWSVAQVALARLDSARSQGMVPMADLDRMLIVAEQAAAVEPNDDLIVIRAAQEEVSGLIADEDRTIANLRGQIAG